MTTISPSPWVVKEYFGDDDGSWLYDHTIVDADGGFVCHTSMTSVWGGTSEHTEANARLIAAAPELLAACEAACQSLASQQKYIVDDVQAIGHNTDAIDTLNAAIAKAKGGTP